MEVTSLGYRTDLVLLELGGTTIEDRGDHLVVRSPHNPTYWWGNFLLLRDAPAPEASARWVDRFAAAFPHARHVTLGVDAVSGDVGALAWFAERGFTCEAQAVLTATQVHEPAHWHEAAICRAISSDGDWAESVELDVRCNEQQLEPIGYRAFATARASTNRGLVEDGHGAWFGAFVDGRLVCQMGLVLAGPTLARFQTVHTDPRFRRQGLAGSLVLFASHCGFDQLGARTLVMVADPSYFAIDLYRAVGFQATEAQLSVELPPPS